MLFPRNRDKSKTHFLYSERTNLACSLHYKSFMFSNVKSAKRQLFAAAAIGLLLISPTLADDQQVPKCVDVRKLVIYRAFGYDHIVNVDNHCKFSVDCAIWTNVNPKKIRVKVASGDRAEVLTFRGSPARIFTPYAKCHEAK